MTQIKQKHIQAFGWISAITLIVSIFLGVQLLSQHILVSYDGSCSDKAYGEDHNCGFDDNPIINIAMSWFLPYRPSDATKLQLNFPSILIITFVSLPACRAPPVIKSYL